jgi:hypothetical protein
MVKKEKSETGNYAEIRMYFHLTSACISWMENLHNDSSHGVKTVFIIQLWNREYQIRA